MRPSCIGKCDRAFRIVHSLSNRALLVFMSRRFIARSATPFGFSPFSSNQFCAQLCLRWRMSSASARCACNWRLSWRGLRYWTDERSLSRSSFAPFLCDGNLPTRVGRNIIPSPFLSRMGSSINLILSNVMASRLGLIIADHL